MNQVIAEWIFKPQYVLKGSIKEEQLLMRDVSENGNHLKSIGVSEKSRLSKVIKWNENGLQFKQSIKSSEGCFLKTLEGASLNTEVFEDGYTIEIILELPKDGEAYDPWMGILCREGKALSIGKVCGEKELLTTLSYNQGLQWTYHPRDKDYNLTNWSLPKTNIFRQGMHHIAIVNDGACTKLYLNGESDIRNPKEASCGLDRVDGKGWVVGASFWNEEIDGLFTGCINHIRIAKKALPKKEWLISEFQKTCEVEGVNTSKVLLSDTQNYNMVFIPDTQYMQESAPEMVEAMIRWIEDKQNVLQIKFVGHLGDITENSKEDDFKKVRGYFRSLDKCECPYIVTPGNHDYFDEGENFRKHFSGNNENASAFKLINAGSFRYGFLSLDFLDIEKSIAFANEIIKNYSHIPMILFTHDALNRLEDKLIHTDNGEKIWSELIFKNRQIFMMVAGHEFAVGHNKKLNCYGDEVIEMLVNYQAYPKGGNGWVRLLEFDEKKKCINGKTYSPWICELEKKKREEYDFEFLTSKWDEFMISFDFEKRFSVIS